MNRTRRSASRPRRNFLGASAEEARTPPHSCLHDVEDSGRFDLLVEFVRDKETQLEISVNERIHKSVIAQVKNMTRFDMCEKQFLVQRNAPFLHAATLVRALTIFTSPIVAGYRLQRGRTQSVWR